jgi:hypothetical protein
MVRVGFAALAAWVAVTEPWDANGDGRLSIHEVLLFAVRFLAFGGRGGIARGKLVAAQPWPRDRRRVGSAA